MTKYTIKPTTQFKKDLKIAEKSHRNISLLKEVINKLANGEKLEQKYRDHSLTGNWKGHRECHVQPDWLLIYEIDGENLFLYLTRTGTHSDLF